MASLAAQRLLWGGLLLLVSQIQKRVCCDLFQVTLNYSVEGYNNAGSQPLRWAIMLQIVYTPCDSILVLVFVYSASPHLQLCEL